MPSYQNQPKIFFSNPTFQITVLSISSTTRSEFLGLTYLKRKLHFKSKALFDGFEFKFFLDCIQLLALLFLFIIQKRFISTIPSVKYGSNFGRLFKTCKFKLEKTQKLLYPNLPLNRLICGFSGLRLFKIDPFLVELGPFWLELIKYSRILVQNYDLYLIK